MAADDVGDDLRRAAIGDVRGLEVVVALQRLHGEELQRARTGGGVGDGVGAVLRLLDEVLRGVGTEGRIGDQHERRLRIERQRHEVLLGVVVDLLVERRVDRQNRRGGDDERVPVGRGARHVLRRQHQRRAGLVLDHDRLAERLAEFLRVDAHDHVHAAAGGKRHDDVHVSRREVLGERSGARTDQSQRAGEAQVCTSQDGIIGNPPLSVLRALDVPQAPLTARRPPTNDRLGRRPPQRHAHAWRSKGGVQAGYRRRAPV